MLHHSIKTNYPSLWYFITRLEGMIDELNQRLANPDEPNRGEVLVRRSTIIEVMSVAQSQLINAMAKE